MSQESYGLEACETNKGHKVNQLKPPVPYNNRQNPGNWSLPSARALVFNDCRVHCVYCDGSHYSASCSKLSSLNNRHKYY